MSRTPLCMYAHPLSSQAMLPSSLQPRQSNIFRPIAQPRARSIHESTRKQSITASLWKHRAHSIYENVKREQRQLERSTALADALADREIRTFQIAVAQSAPDWLESLWRGSQRSLASSGMSGVRESSLHLDKLSLLHAIGSGCS